MHNIGIVGTGYAGQKILELLSDEPEFKVAVKCDSKSLDIEKLNNTDLVFLAVPHGISKQLAAKINTKIIDLTADHRLTHTYGLPEINKNNIIKADFIANPGCYATACLLATYPIKENIKEVVFDCISGYSGAGKNNPFDYKENIIAYNLTDHFHIKEIEKILGIKVSFTPHVVNTFQGLMCTAHIKLKENLTDIKDIYKSFYKDTKTIITDNTPCTKDTTNTPYCHIGGFEGDKDHLVIISVIDNLMKGAASQAIENAKLMLK
ncbi:MAG: hypothetical protein KJ601_02675 [Nanoarchaeota archaeon]|nr:hypothetical protein [Nanoarchaeota archaeon]MBU1704125.1 hypothetical protein [Nanoarchaeota archaeon]